MSSMARKSPSNIASTQGFVDALPKPRIASGTLPPQAAQAPEFIPGEVYRSFILDQNTDDRKGDRKTSDVSSDREDATEKNKRRRGHKKRPKVEKEAEEEADGEALKQLAIDEEWWSGDDVFVPGLRDKEDFWNDRQS